jgi:putative heme-binding domain-containing protein
MRLLSRLLFITILTIRPAAAQDVTRAEEISTLPGFRVELIHAVDRKSEGSWVALTVDPQGRVLAADQYGGLFRVTPPPPGRSGAAKVERLKADIAGAHGLLHAFDSLYVMVNEKPNTAGLYRLRDTQGTGEFDEKKLLREIHGQGEHGVHSLTLAPDGRSIYIACGNDTANPGFQHTRAAAPLAEDLAVPRINRGGSFSDARPHAFTAKVSPDGSRFELIAAGMRNHFDLAFNALGDLFTYDSDMEWDAGTPWYRPTRIYQVLSGGDYGFRESSGKLQGYCEDIAPPLCEVGPGSPTGMTSGLGAAFPARHQHAIYACDWTYGTLYAVHLTPQGAGYAAKLEEFVSGKPLPLTDVTIGKDGAMYFATGGRRVQSALYRVTYHGTESTAPAPPPAETPEHRLRVELEKLHEEGTGPDAVEKAWPHLGHADRLVRHAARIAVERQPAELWIARALQQTEPWAVIESSIALARRGGKDHQAALLEQLNRLEFTQLDAAQQIALVRACQVSVAREGMPADEARAATLARLEKLYPATGSDLNRELAIALVALDSPNVVARTLALMKTARDEPVPWLSADLLARNDSYGPNFLRTGPARPIVQQIAYAHTLRHARSGWTPELRREFFAWFLTTRQWQGGNQFRGFLDQIRADALASVPDAAERKELSDLSTLKSLDANPVPIRPPRGPGKHYTAGDLTSFTPDALKNRDFARGRELYIAAACQACHRLGIDGGGIGPDLTGAANRYTLGDLLENIVEPSKVISDQYESSVLEMKDGRTIVGRVSGEEGGILQVVVDPSAPNRTTDLMKSEVKMRQVSPVSLMPPGLIDSMNRNEVLDLAAYILSGGQRSNPMFKK